MQNKRNRKFFSDVVLFYFHAALFAFAEIVFLVSLPILLWTKGFSLTFIFGFYALAALPGYLFTKSFVLLMLRCGIKKILLLGVLFYVCLGAISPLLQPENKLWLIALFLLGIQALFYFPARHLYFTEIISHKDVGWQSGGLNAVVTIARTVAPIISGLVFIFSEFNWVFAGGAFVMLLSVLPILFIKTQISDHIQNVHFDDFSLNNEVFQNTRPAYIAEGGNGVISYTLWPLLFFLFISQNNYFQLGSLMTVSYGISAIIMLIVGHFFDKKHRKKLLRVSVFSNIIAALGRFGLLFYHPYIFVYLVQSFYSFSESALQSAFEAYWYSYSKKTNPVFYTIHREKYFALGRFFVAISLAIVSLFFQDAQNLWPFFLLSVPMVFLFLRKTRSDEYLNS